LELAAELDLGHGLVVHSWVMKIISPSLASSLVALAFVAAAWCNPPQPTPPPGGVFCPPGYFWNGVTCLVNPGAPGFTPEPHPGVFCPPGYFWNGVTCLLSPIPTFAPMPTPPPIIWPTPLPSWPSHPVCPFGWPRFWCSFK